MTILLSIILLYNVLSWLNANALPFYHQDDYDIKPEIVEVVWYDHSIARDVKTKLGWYNRTSRLLNISFYNLVENGTTDLVGEVQLYKFMSNEYRFFPLTVGTNLCHEYAQNNFNLQNLLKNKSNIRGCPLEKGLYYIRNFMPDFSLLPPYIPRGRYKAVGKLIYNKKVIGEGNAYGEVIDKPIKRF